MTRGNACVRYTQTTIQGTIDRRKLYNKIILFCITLVFIL
jgi:hypothetical protein